MYIAHLLVSVASAQTTDGTGVAGPPDGISLHDGMLGWSARFPGAPVVDLTGWFADEPLVRRVTDGPTTVDRPVVDDLYGASAGVLLPVGGRVAIGARLPVWFGSSGSAGGGLAPGDAALSAPIRALDAGPGRLLVVPSLRVPTGADARYLGDPGVGGSVVGSGSIASGRASASLDLGLTAGPSTGVPDWPGGLGATWAVDLAVTPAAIAALHLEAAGRAPLGRSLPGVPTELLLSARVRPTERLVLCASGGTGLIRGVGAAAMRFGVGVRAGLGKSPSADAPPVVDPTRSVLRVVDERGWPVVNATVTGGTVRGITDADGRAALPPRAGRVGALEVSAPGFEVATVATTEDQTSWDVALVRLPVTLSGSVVGPDGPLPETFVDVETASDDPGGPGRLTTDAAGGFRAELGRGTWTVHLGAPGMAEQARTVVVEPSRVEPIRVDAILTPLEDPAVVLAVNVVDGYGQPVEDAVVALGERDLGTTGTGGDVVVNGLEAGEVAVVVRSSRFADRTVVPAALAAGRNEVRAVLDWPAGSVLVRVTDTKGRPVDAGVAWTGPAALPVRQLGSDGEELFVLRPGTWTLRTSADAFAPQSRLVAVPDHAGEVLRMDVALLPSEGGELALDLHVQDIDGGVVPGAQVLVDGAPIGVTGTDGTVRLEELSAGQRFLEVRGDLLVPAISEATLSAPLQREDVVVWYTTGVVDVEVRGPDQRLVDALIAFEGPSAVAPTATGGDGKLRVVLPPGTWQLATSSDDYGLRVDEVTVVADERRRHYLPLRVAPVHDETAALEVTVLDPEGGAVDAEVLVDGVSTGRTPGGHVRLEGLAPGPAVVDVTADGHLAEHREVTLEDVVPLAVTLPWAPGSLAVRVVGPDGPVDGALIALAGPGTVPSRETTAGEARFAVAPGTWWVLASHEDFAVAEASVVLPADPRLTRLELTLAVVEPDVAQFVLSVRDEAGAPLAGVPVVIDGVQVGKTSAGGTFALVDRPAGDEVVTLTPGPGFAAVEVPVRLDKGEQDRSTVVVPFADTPVKIAVPGAAPGTKVVLYGDEPGPRSAVVGADGTATVALPPGPWTAVAEDPTRAGSTRVEVIAGRPVQARIDLYETGSTVTGGLVRLTQPILFDVASAILRPEAATILDDVARRLVVDRKAALVEIQGHTSDEGGVAYNQQLSEERARAIRVALVERGVEPERLVSRGYGLSRPLTAQRDEPSRAGNRRVELVILDYVEL